jgi:prepilin-type N-terminal cleavage/methylation domain-containing protein
VTDPVLRQPDHGDGEAGFTLVEIVASIALLGLASLVVMGGLWTVVKSSEASAAQARVEAVLTSAADRVTSTSYVPCPPASGPGSYGDVAKAAASTVDWDPSVVSITSLQFWDPSAPGGSNWVNNNDPNSGNCNPNVGLTTARTLQKITIRVVAPNSGYSRTLEVVKSNVIPKQNIVTP